MIAIARIVLTGVIMLGMVSSASAKSRGDGAYQTGFIRWRAADVMASSNFSNWTLGSGVTLNTDGALEFDSAANLDLVNDPYPVNGYYGGNYYNGGSFYVGEATSPVVENLFDYQEAIASWNAFTPPGSWVEIQIRARYGQRWSKWYVLGIWASDYSTIKRHSVRLQGDTDGFVAVDTFVSSNKKETTNAFQLKILLFSKDKIAIPSVQNASVAYSTTAPKSASATTDNLAVPNIELNVPQYSQYVYPDGGEVWCSPVSTSMDLAFLDSYTGFAEPRVRAAVDGVFDWIYDGHGNWPFNTAYAASDGKYEAYVARFASLDTIERFVAAGIPVIMSIAWDKGDLTNSGIQSTNGHLLTVVGFDDSGNVIVNDPANDPTSPQTSPVRRTYLREELEPLWLQASGGTVYLIYPEGTTFTFFP
jgi:hypothetical protein